MRYFKAVGLCLVAMFVLGSITVASASAEVPTFLFLEGGGGKPGFTSHTGKGKLLTKGGTEVKCESAENKGKVVPGTDQVEGVTITFKGCTATVLGQTFSCKSPEAKEEGLIDSAILHGNLGYIEKTPELKVGLLLLPEVKGALFSEFSCGTGIAKTTIKVRGRNEGGIISEVLPSSVERELVPPEDGELTFNQTEPGVQQWTSLEVLGTLHDELLLEAKIGSKEYELSSIQENENVKVLFEESVKITG